MKRETFNQGFAALLNAYTYAQDKFTVESEEVYWEMLKDLPDEAFNRGVRGCMANSKFFPSIAELGEMALPTIEALAQPYNPWNDNSKTVKLNWEQQLVEIKRRQFQIENNSKKELAKP